MSPGRQQLSGMSGESLRAIVASKPNTDPCSRLFWASLIIWKCLRYKDLFAFDNARHDRRADLAVSRFTGANTGTLLSSLVHGGTYGPGSPCPSSASVRQRV